MNPALITLLVLVSILLIIALTTRFRLHAFAALFIVSLLLAAVTLPSASIVSALKEGFGNTMGSIGFLIIFGAMIGVILDRTGATLSIAGFILSKTGEKRSPVALGLTGFLTGLPIFCDSGFIVLSGLARSLSRKSAISMTFMATVLATSLYSVHCLIPPHPGALAAAGMVNANIGLLIIAGILFAVPGAVSAYIWSAWASRKFNAGAPAAGSDTEVDPRQSLPPVLLSFLPIALPLFLITAKSAAVLLDKEENAMIRMMLELPGEPVIALFAGVLCALLLLKRKSIGEMNSVMADAILKAGPILIITAAGGMFGMVIRSTGAGEILGEKLAGSGIGLLIPFLIAAIMKTAQGSSTVAIITSASIVAPMLGTLSLGSEWGRVLALLSMGAGSMIASHANDSYFWVVTNFSDIKVRDTLKIYSTSTIIMGVVVFACIWLVSLFIL